MYINPRFFIQSSTKGHFGCFRVLATTNKCCSEHRGPYILTDKCFQFLVWSYVEKEAWNGNGFLQLHVSRRMGLDACHLLFSWSSCSGGPLGPASFAPLSAFCFVCHISEQAQEKELGWQSSVTLQQMDSNSGSAIGQIPGRLGHVSISLSLFLFFCKVGIRILMT